MSVPAFVAPNRLALLLNSGLWILAAIARIQLSARRREQYRRPSPIHADPQYGLGEAEKSLYVVGPESAIEGAADKAGSPNLTRCGVC